MLILLITSHDTVYKMFETMAQDSRFASYMQIIYLQIYYSYILSTHTFGFLLKAINHYSHIKIESKEIHFTI